MDQRDLFVVDGAEWKDVIVFLKSPKGGYRVFRWSFSSVIFYEKTSSS